MAKQPLTLLREQVKGAILGGEGSRLPRLADLAANFFDIAGGERAVAQMMWDEYNSPKCSPMVRSRILQLVLDSAEFAERQRGPDVGDTGDLSAEDIERLLEAKLRDLLGSVAKGGDDDPAA